MSLWHLMELDVTHTPPCQISNYTSLPKFILAKLTQQFHLPLLTLRASIRTLFRLFLLSILLVDILDGQYFLARPTTATTTIKRLHVFSCMFINIVYKLI